MSATMTSAAPSTGSLTSDHRGSWLPTWPMITSKFMELRKRRGLMVAIVFLTLALPVLVLGLRLLFHAVDPSHYGPAGSPSVFEGLCDPIAQFGFIIAAAVGATAGATDLGEGMFRHLVITGRSRVALFFARVPSGLALLLPLVAIGFTFMCLVTAFEGTPQPTNVTVDGATIPLNLSEGQLHSFLLGHASEFAGGPVFKSGDGSITFGGGGPAPNPQQFIRSNFSNIYQDYLDAQATRLNPPANEMVKIGLWIELQVALGFIIGLGLGSLTGQRTVTVIVLVALQIIVTPLLSAAVIPYFLNGQRLLVGVAMEQLRPAALISVNGIGHHGPGRAILGGRGALGIPAMPTWAMISVIVGWIVAWTGIGAWRMATRDA
jgi:hypothetical protein